MILKFCPPVTQRGQVRPVRQQVHLSCVVGRAHIGNCFTGDADVSFMLIQFMYHNSF